MKTFRDQPLVNADWRNADSRRSATICEPKAAKICGGSFRIPDPNNYGETNEFVIGLLRSNEFIRSDSEAKQLRGNE